MAETGNPNAVSDAGVGVLCARAAIRGAYLNVKTNAVGLDDPDYVTQVLTEAESLVDRAERLEVQVLARLG